MPTRVRLENMSIGHYKFWEITDPERDLNAGDWYTIRRWGRIGTAGQSKVDRFKSFAEADRFIWKMMNDKASGGYHAVKVNTGAPPVQSVKMPPATPGLTKHYGQLLEAKPKPQPKPDPPEPEFRRFILK